MSFPFGKKKHDQQQPEPEEKKGSAFDRFEEELTVLEKEEMAKVEGGKSANKSFSDFSDLRNSFSGSIPL